MSNEAGIRRLNWRGLLKCQSSILNESYMGYGRTLLFDSMGEDVAAGGSTRGEEF